jgi:hypothetical protein
VTAPRRLSLILLVALAVVLAAAVALAGPAAARTSAVHRFAVGSPGLQSALRIAHAHWRTDPCGGSVSVAAGPYAHPAQNGDCQIALNPAVRFDWPKLCTVVMHEVGHLVGHPHDRRPGHLMSPYYSGPAPECRVTPRGGASPRRATARRAG